MASGKLIVCRHHESLWNKQGVWTGSRDIGLSEYGYEMSGKMGELVKGMRIDHIFISTQIRTEETLMKMLETADPAAIEKIQKGMVPLGRSAALNERDYGDYTGKNKWEMQKLIGSEKFDDIRRGWNVPVPHGETLKMVYERTVPYYLSAILPVLKDGKNVLVVSSGNAIRSLMKYIEHISNEGIKDVEMLFGGVVIYEVDAEGYMVSREERKIDSHVNA